MNSEPGTWEEPGVTPFPREHRIKGQCVDCGRDIKSTEKSWMDMFSQYTCEACMDKAGKQEADAERARLEWLERNGPQQ